MKIRMEKAKRVTLTPELKQKIKDLKLINAKANKTIAVELGISKDSVSRVLKDVFIPKEIKAKAYQDYTDDFLDEAIKTLNQKQLTIHDIAEQHKISPVKRLQEALYRRRGYYLDKEQISLVRSKYDKKLKLAIREEYSNGASFGELSTKYSVKPDAVKFIVAGINKKLNKVKASGFNSYGERIESIITKRGGKSLGPFVNNTTKIKIECEKGHVFEGLAGGIIYGHWCDQCVHHTSAGELCLKSFISQFVHDFEKNRGLLGKYEIDLYSPSKKIGIELNGQYFHGEAFNHKNKNKHYEKFKLAEAAGIKLITIYDSELNNKAPQLEGYLKAILGVSERKVGARETSVEPVDHKVCFDFCEKHHIQGGVTGSVYYGLFYKKELVGVAIFKTVNDHEMDLARYCLPNGTSVSGGLGKILSYFKANNPEIKKITSFSDNRYSQGGIYINNGFKLVKELRPDYMYFKRGFHELLHKFGFRKAKIEQKLGALLPNETEWEAMQRFGYDRIWDCGKRKWALDL